MAWLSLFFAGLTEIGWAVMILSFFLLAHSLKTIPIGTAYAVWTGIGIMGTVILGILLFNEPVSFCRILFLSMILIGIVGLKVTQ